MKRVNRKDFINTPVGTIFSETTDCFMDWEGLFIKGSDGDYGNDFSFCSLYNEIGFEFDNSGDMNGYIADEKLNRGESISIDTECYGRDGCFEEEKEYIVFEKEDIEKMIKTLQKSLK